LGFLTTSLIDFFSWVFKGGSDDQVRKAGQLSKNEKLSTSGVTAGAYGCPSKPAEHTVSKEF